MQAELIEIRNHLAQHEPFEDLPPATLDKVAARVEIAYYRAGSTITEFGEPATDLHYIRSGAVEIFRRSGELYNRLSEGDIFGQLGLMMGRSIRFPAKAIEDTLLYCIPADLFEELWETEETFADFVEIEDRTRLRSAVEKSARGSELMTAKVTRLIARPLVSASDDIRLQEAARIMTEERVSALLLMDESGDRPRMSGIITDRDFRTRAVTEALPSETPVSDVMTTELITIRSEAFIFEAMLTMLHNNVHHLPVVHNGEPRGIIGLSDIIRYESQSSVFVVSNIHRQTDVQGLKAVSKDVRDSFVRMVNEDANSKMIGSAMAGIGRSISQRLLELGEEKLGPAPVPYCFMALGSMARDEQLVVTDQDNALVLDDSFDPAVHDDYFQALAKFVSDGLAACGYTYCTGDIMATNIKWRQPLRIWKTYFMDWIHNPKAENLLNSNIFFDLEGIHGRLAFTEELKELVASEAMKSQRFLALMARNALNRTPPLGFFRTFVMEQDGKQNDTINLKRRGTGPLSDLIRIHALACGSRAQNSFERLQAVKDAKLLPAGSVENLRDALEFIAIVRIRHQAAAIEAGQEPNNNVQPEELSPFERRNLKDAFQILSNGQKFLRFRYQAPTGRHLA
ncbi:putative nucleotidyltransferase substrate binding domain-containing protein [Marinobacter sp.]|uniref:putative nucleotidyltransferase substrate binding domain-containing protein n=1 Tax=Marinobacter sp. TaxID=50741 RepID=UPI00384F766D